MEPWELAWLNCQGMPPHAFPKELLVPAEETAEEWLLDATFRCILEEWVSAPEADEVLGGLLWSGFCLRGQPQKRVPPVPVLVRLLYTTPLPADETETRDRMRALFANATREWCRAYQQYQHALRVAP